MELVCFLFRRVERRVVIWMIFLGFVLNVWDVEVVEGVRGFRLLDSGGEVGV